METSRCKETDGYVVQQLDEINQDVVVRMEEVPIVASDLLEEECRDATQECSHCEGIYELNEELMRERCDGIPEDACARASLEEGAMEEWIFSSDDEDEADDVGGGALDDLQAKYIDFRTVPPAGVSGGSELAEEDDADCAKGSGLVFDLGKNSTWTETRAGSDHLGLDDIDGTVRGVGDAYGEELNCGTEQCEGSIGGLSGGSLDGESVDPRWASTVGEMSFESQRLVCDPTSGIEGNVCPKSGIEEGSLIDASVLSRHCFLMEETGGSQKHTISNVGSCHVFDPGEEQQHIAMNPTLEGKSSPVGVGRWSRRLEECCRDLQLGTAILRDRLHRQGGRRFADTGKPVLRLRGEGSVPRKQGRRKSCGGRRVKPPAKRQRLAGPGNSIHEVRAKGLTGTITGGLVLQDGQCDSRLLEKHETRVDPEGIRIHLVGEAQTIRGRELELNSLFCLLNVMAGWVSVSEAVSFDRHIRSTSSRSFTPQRPYGYRYLCVYHVLLFNALHPYCANCLVNAVKIHAWRLATEEGRTAMETLVLHNILRSDAAEKCGKDSIEDEYLRMVDPMAVPLLYVLVAFSIGKTDKKKHALHSAENLTTWWINCWEQNQRVYSRVC